jgi:hypothetical protein
MAPGGQAAITRPVGAGSATLIGQARYAARDQQRPRQEPTTQASAREAASGVADVATITPPTGMWLCAGCIRPRLL